MVDGRFTGTVGGRHAGGRCRAFQRPDLVRQSRQSPQRATARHRALYAHERQPYQLRGDHRGPESVHPAVEDEHAAVPAPRPEHANPGVRVLPAALKSGRMRYALVWIWRSVIMRVFLATIAIASLCLVGAAAQGQGSAQAPVMTDEVFKSVQVLKGIPVDTFFESMGMFASAMGDDCTFCHVKEAYFDRAKFAVSTPKIVRARGMVLMMNGINKSYFQGEQRVTCFTCHRGNNTPVREPDLSLQYGASPENPNVIAFPEYPLMSASTLFEKYFQAIGGRQRVAAP